MAVNTEKFAAVLRELSVPGEVRELPAAAPTAATAAAQLGCEVGAIANSLVDTWLARHEVVWAAGGHPHTIFPTSYGELLRITGGTPADVGA